LAPPSLALPQLRIVPRERLILHEQHDAQRSAPLAERLRIEGALINPPMVTALSPNEDRYVVLDGANRVTAAELLDLPHMLVQVVDYDDPELQLSTWYHVVTACERETFTARLNTIDGLTLTPSSLLHARAALARREVLAYLVCPGEEVLLVEGGHDLHSATALLNALVDAYKDVCRIYRANSDRIAQLATLYPDLVAIVVFPHYEPVEILEVARHNARLPAGITRHIIPRRALRLNLPLDILADQEQTTEQKNAWLQDWLQRKVANKQVRYYAESTVLFDE
jgi:hypothetical protein